MRRKFLVLYTACTAQSFCLGSQMSSAFGQRSMYNLASVPPCELSVHTTTANVSWSCHSGRMLQIESQMMKTNTGMQTRYLRRWCTPSGKKLYSRPQVAKFLGVGVNLTSSCCVKENMEPWEGESGQRLSGIRNCCITAAEGPHALTTTGWQPTATVGQHSPMQNPAAAVARSHPSSTVDQQSQQLPWEALCWEPPVQRPQHSSAAAAEPPAPATHVSENAMHLNHDGSMIHISDCEPEALPHPQPPVSNSTCMLNPPQQGAPQSDDEKLAALECALDSLEKEGLGKFTVYLLPPGSSFGQLPAEPNQVSVVHKSYRLINNQLAALVQYKTIN